MNTISPLAYVHPEAQIGDNNTIGPFCYIDRNTVIGDNNLLQNSVTINYGARIGNHNEFFAGGSISAKPQDLKFQGEDTICEIGDYNSFRENVNISRGTASKGSTKIGNHCLLMENVHVAHDCVLGNNLIIGNSTKIAGEVIIDDKAIISASVLIHQFCRVGGYVMIQGGTRFSMDVPPYIIVGKEPARFCGLNLVGLRRRGFSPETINQLHEAYRLIHSRALLEESIAAIREQLPATPEIDYVVNFAKSSKRGIIR
ncbi:MAG: acyl-ACP--UDP-N-acetylglucosamine O-acyltransferase [Prevotella sp.]|nr:acyl-ACP--UDP-N-acetylglucosamine O-acyltransferase [Prevotella sp.]MBP5507655.1 acyl-ACP--UDP-N-acetylglucosamine O-acyltransferase [Prevotella sp.]